MKLFKKFKDKLFNFIDQFNQINTTGHISDKSYISGSKIFGNVTIGINTKIYKSFIEGNINIGNFSSIWGPNSFIIGRKYGVEIGSFCSIAKNVNIQEDNHNFNKISTYYIEKNLFNESIQKNEIVSKGKIIIGNDVWIGAGVQILSNVNVGDGAVLAAGSIVTKDVPPYSIVGGNPAKIIKYRFDDEIIDKLCELKWWNWELQKIQRNEQLFKKDSLCLKDFENIK